MSKDVAKDVKGPSKRFVKKGLFLKDLAPMMYGFGDDNPSQDTISVMEELVIEHITDVCAQAQRVSSTRGKIKVDDFKFALRKDPKKLARVDELLFMTEVIARARGKDEMKEIADEEEAAAKKAANAPPPPPPKDQPKKGAATAAAAGSGGAEGSKKKSSSKGKSKA